MEEDKKNVLLIWPQFDIPNRNFLPLGFGYILSNMSGRYNVELKDFVLDKYSDKILIGLIKKFKPLAIGISFWEINYKTIKYLVKKIKEFNSNSIIILGGPSASSRINSGLEEIGADFAIKGEGEKSFEFLLNLISSNKVGDYDNLNKVPGLTYFNRLENSYQSIPIEPLDLEDINWPDYENIRIEEYLARDYDFGYFSKKIKNCPIITTRGCPYQCEFCSARTIHGLGVRKRAVSSILEEIEYLYNRYSIRGINVIDDNFTFDKDFVIELSETIISSKYKMPGLRMGTPNGLNMKTLDDAILSLMKQAGWESITIAPESGSEKTLKNMRKYITLEEIRYYVLLIKKYKFRLSGFFIIGYPGETVEDIKKTIDFACSLPFDQITFSPFNPLPGTPIYDKLLKEGQIDINYASGNYFNITYSPPGISLRQLSGLLKEALFRSILLSPRRLFFLLKFYSLKRIFNYIIGYFFKKA